MSLDAFLKRNLYWISDFFHGRKVRKHFNTLKVVLSNSKKGKIIQKKNLDDLLKHATRYSKFYVDYSGKELSEFPVVNKNILNENHDLVAIDYQYIPGQKTKEIHIQKTSGSTGTPFSVFQDTRKRDRRIAELKYFGEDVGFKSHEKLGQCRIWTKWQSKSKKQCFWENIIPINISKMDDATLATLCQKVREEKIVSLRAYASWYEKMVEYFESGKGNPDDFSTIKVAISSSESLNPETRIKMKALTGVPIVECYANEEAGILAQQKVDDVNYYLNHDGYVFELLKLDSDEPVAYGELGRIVITDLFNYAFPLIRYDTGDTGILCEGNEISHGWDYMSKLYGRRLDLIYDTTGNPIHPMNFARVLKNIPTIIQWQVIQKDEKKYVLKLNMRQDVKHELTEILNEMKNIVGLDSVVEIEEVDEIPVLASGKRKPVICEWKNDRL